MGLNFAAYPQEMEDSLNALFTDAEFRAIYEANNLRMNITNGSMATNEEIPARSAISLWQNIETEADAALRSSSHQPPSVSVMIQPSTRLLSLLFDRHLALLPVHVKKPTWWYSEQRPRMVRVVPTGCQPADDTLARPEGQRGGEVHAGTGEISCFRL